MTRGGPRKGAGKRKDGKPKKKPVGKNTKPVPNNAMGMMSIGLPRISESPLDKQPFYDKEAEEAARKKGAKRITGKKKLGLEQEILRKEVLRELSAAKRAKNIGAEDKKKRHLQNAKNFALSLRESIKKSKRK